VAATVGICGSVANTPFFPSILKSNSTSVGGKHILSSQVWKLSSPLIENVFCVRIFI
jgi:hypothetical protein